MSKINAVRFINLNYNNNAIRISDETFHLNGESTLLSLRNGGGKSVLVQMMMAPFLHKRYQNAKDRPFASYFTTNKPTFIMVEWKLDQGAGYVLTGMMVRKNQEPSEEGAEELETVNFISEYREPCPRDIHHLPVVEKTKKEVVLKGFHACRQLFEGYKRERGVAFFYYDMNNQAQSRQYFDKLGEYQIHYKEWETIIKKVNLKESGLSDLFADCKDEKGLVEKWFLEAVEDKLNKDKNRMKEFQVIMEKYTGQYRDNQSKIQRRDAIRAFEQDAEQIRGQAVGYRDVTEELEDQKARIGMFLRGLHDLKEEELRRERAAEVQREELEGKLSYLEYEKLSGEIYELADREKFTLGNLGLLQTERNDLERVRDQVSHKLHLFSCARQQENVAEAEAERDKEIQRLQLCMQEEKNVEPERQRLGADLRRYYQGLADRRQEESRECGEGIQRMEQEKADAEAGLEALREEQGNLLAREGALKAVIGTYDSTEESFNREYHENWSRNILGEYETGVLQIGGAEYEKELEETGRRRVDGRREIQELKLLQKSSQRRLEERRADQIRCKAQKKELEKQFLEYEKELAERRVILKYFELEEQTLFEREKILEAAESKLSSTDMVRRELEQEAAGLERELSRLAQGQVLELPEEFAGMLAEAGIHYVYGMEWLRKNQYTVEQNQKLAAQHPFLPYSLILSRQELMRLGQMADPVYTSFPVPILLREELEGGGDIQHSAVCSFGQVSFYVWFNGNLLDQEKLTAMLAQKAAVIQRLKGAISQKQAEYQEYFAKKEKIKLQKVTRQSYEEAGEEAKRKEQELADLDTELLKLREELEALENDCQLKEQQVLQLEREYEYRQRRIVDFKKLTACYEQYRENVSALEKNERALERVLDKQRLKKGIIDRLEQELASGRNRMAALERELEECNRRLARFAQYPLKEHMEAEEMLTAKAAAEAEGRYEVITSGITAEQKELEARLEAAQKRFAKARRELLDLQERYELPEGSWKGVHYDRKEERHQETLLKEQERKLDAKEGQIKREEIQYAVQKQERENKLKELQTRCGKQEPVARQEIRTIDFGEVIKGLEYEKRQVEERMAQIRKRLQGCESNLTALAEYEDFAGMEPVEWDCDLSAMETEGFTRCKGILIRDYNSCMERRREAKSRLERVLNQVIRKDQFAEEFYQKPLESMLQLTEDAKQVLKQLEVTLASYNNLMEKLMVDISMVEKEKARIVELMGEYLHDVHENLGKIDHNSTITIRERPVKMLKIEIPDWGENESFYELRLLDYIDDITKRGITLLSENKNVQEYLGTRVTTKALYDAVVGIGSVQIRLYKIEAQREYPITWAEVAKNSGGEGFLSAFVVLSALLYYMRRDDGDIFADRNEGKVLLMDNPFAQTNASHLLKPLMDMAKKANTQLICLSGLGGEAIYSQFDNIYVLTLIAANLRSDMQYLKAEHMRGSGEETVLSSRIEVMEQLELVF